MYVKELIELLKNYNEDTPVVIQNGGDDQEIAQVITDVAVTRYSAPSRIAIIVPARDGG